MCLFESVKLFKYYLFFQHILEELVLRPNLMYRFRQKKFDRADNTAAGGCQTKPGRDGVRARFCPAASVPGRPALCLVLSDPGGGGREQHGDICSPVSPSRRRSLLFSRDPRSHQKLAVSKLYKNLLSRRIYEKEFSKRPQCPKVLHNDIEILLLLMSKLMQYTWHACSSCFGTQIFVNNCEEYRVSESAKFH